MINNNENQNQDALRSYWTISAADAIHILNSSEEGLSDSEAAQRLRVYGPNLFKPKAKSGVLTEFLEQFKSPITLLLLFAAILSFFLQDSTDAAIIIIIVFLSGLLSFWQQHKSSDAMAKLLDMVQITTNVLRDGKAEKLPLERVVPGDVVLLSAGDLIPGDALIIELKDLFADEAVLTGESYPVEKQTSPVALDMPAAKRLNVLHMGTHISSGTAKVLVVRTGKATMLGQISEQLRLTPPETEFERGVRHFGYLLMEVTMVLIIAVFAINVFFHRPILDSFLFSMALAVGLTPQLLPAIISINLAQGATHMAREKVIVKRLAAIENLGSMDVLCSDKTGTLTEGVMQLHSAIDTQGRPWDRVADYAYLNAFFQNGYKNPIDSALTAVTKDVSGYTKLDEFPYDFVRKRVSVLVAHEDRHYVISKGAFNQIFAACSQVELSDGKLKALSEVGDEINKFYIVQSQMGFRVLAVAYKEIPAPKHIDKYDEEGLTLLGFLLFNDPAKAGAQEAIERLGSLGISFKMITGDNQYTARHVWQEIGLAPPRVMTGTELHKITARGLPVRVTDIDVFAEVEPDQKERIIHALKQAGHVVGYLGDGVNDSPALHMADVGISVNTAVDVAKEAASFVLLEKDLNVLATGVGEGRRTFANTLKYVFMATSANFGNMFSMAGASLIMPFLPLLPTQILLTNLLTDVPETTIATDLVDPELVARPRRWDIGFIRKFMLTFGLLSSIFDYLTFGVLLWLLHAAVEQFRTGWFLESVISATIIVLVIRTRHPFFRSRIGKYLVLSTGAVVAAVLLLPYSPLAALFQFIPLPPVFMAILGVIVIVYVACAELVKKQFYRLIKY